MAGYAEVYESARTGERGERRYREVTRAVAAETEIHETLVEPDYEFLSDAGLLSHLGSGGSSLSPIAPFGGSGMP